MKDVTQNQVGKIIKSGERDAVHIAVLPVIASKDLQGGEHVGFLNGKTTESDYIGIIDPFLSKVKVGQMCYIFLYPNSITSLRHLWIHPSIPDDIHTSASKQISEQWLRNFIESADCPDYDTVIAAAIGAHVDDVEEYGNAYTNDGDSLFFAGRDAHSDIPSEFWDHVEIVTGKKIPASGRAKHFSCSC